MGMVTKRERLYIGIAFLVIFAGLAVSAIVNGWSDYTVLGAHRLRRGQDIRGSMRRPRGSDARHRRGPIVFHPELLELLDLRGLPDQPEAPARQEPQALQGRPGQREQGEVEITPSFQINFSVARWRP